jgi:sortase A
VQPSFVAAPVRGRPPLSLLVAGLRRPGGRRATSVLAIVLLLAGVGLLAYPFATNIYQHHLQGDLKSQLQSPQYALEYQKHQIKVGDGLTELIMPKLDVDVAVVEGTTASALRAGAGHYPDTALPCQAGNVAIAGHRTTFGHPFNRLDEMRPGDEVELKTPFQACFYKAVANTDFAPANPHPVDPTDTTVIDQNLTKHELTLTTCHPKGSAAQRLILRLVMEPAKTQTFHPKLPSGATQSPPAP